MTAMFTGGALCLLKRFSSTSAVASPALLGSLSHTVSDASNVENTDEILNPEICPSVKKTYVRKITRPRYALLMSFHGANYFGMQYNVHGPAIENKLFDAFVKMGILAEESARAASFNLEFSRASRTDRGVSALRQVVSIRMVKGQSIDGINEFLPDDIRVLGMKRVCMAFSAQKWCDARSYSYIMPTYALCSYHKVCNPCQDYRIDSDTLLKASQIFGMFRGTHKFHNYTEKRDLWDARSSRKIVHTQVSDPFLMGDIEMVEFNITGHSFMLHQIRRMLGMTIAIMRGKAPFHLLQETLEHPMMPAPTAPALGLLLEKQHFYGYNQRYGDDYPLDWDEYDDEVNKFKLEKIVPYMVAVEREEHHMETFLSDKLRRHSFRSNAESSRLRKVAEWNQIGNLDNVLETIDSKEVSPEKEQT